MLVIAKDDFAPPVFTDLNQKRRDFAFDMSFKHRLALPRPHHQSVPELPSTNIAR